MREAEMQTKIIATMEQAGWYVVKLIQTNKNGIPDLLCIRHGSLLFIEVKAGKNKASPLQHYRSRQLAAHGAPTIIAYDLKDIAPYLNKPTDE